MADRLLIGPRAEPIALAEAKIHGRFPAATTEDELIKRAIRAARRHVSSWCRRALVREQRLLTLDRFGPCIEIPVGPVRAVQSIEYIDTNQDEQTLDASLYRVDIESERARITPAWGTTWPSTLDVTNAVSVTYTAGHAVPIASVDSNTEIITAYGHDLLADAPVSVSNSGGGVPGGLSVATPYYVISPTTDTLKLSATSGGSAVDITGAGTGNSFIGEIPDEIVDAMHLIVAHLYEHREENSDFEVFQVPFGVERLLAPYRTIRF